MDIVIKYLFTFTLLTAEIALLAFVLSVVMPHFVLRLRYCTDHTVDRGLHRYVYEGGRAITYEPHPRERKYLPMYTLFCHEGYKYFRPLADKALHRVYYRITTFDRRDRVIDTVTVNETIHTPGVCAPVMLHHATSYVCVQVLSVNEEPDERRPLVHVRPANAWLFVLLSMLTVLAATLLLSLHARAIYELIAMTEPPVPLRVTNILLPAVLIGALYSFIVLHAAKRKV